jgi:hypothetical protein
MNDEAAHEDDSDEDSDDDEDIEDLQSRLQGVDLGRCNANQCSGSELFLPKSRCGSTVFHIEFVPYLD